MSRELTVGSLFAGIGGFDLGLERAGMRSVWQCEIDPYCQRVLAKHWPDVLRVPDVRGVGAGAVPRVDVIAGGFPCQDLSLVGKGAGLDGARSGLWFEMARVVHEVRPRYVVVENVRALVVRGLDAVLGSLAEIGYDAEWDCLPASAFGAPHQRDRIWLVAYPAGEGLEGPRVFGRSPFRGAPLGDTDRGERDAGRRELGPSGRREPRDPGWWSAEPDVGRALDGFSAWLDGAPVIRQPHELVSAYANATGRDAAEALRALRGDDGTQDVQRALGGCGGLSTPALLLAYLRELAHRCDGERAASTSPEAAWAALRSLRADDKPRRSPRRPGPGEQHAGERADALQEVSRLLAHDAEAAWLAYRRSDACPPLNWEAGISRVAVGIPERVDRVRALGNALVPQIAEWIGRRILEHEGLA